VKRNCALLFNFLKPIAFYQTVLFLIIFPVHFVYAKVPIASLMHGQFIGRSLQIFRSPIKLNIQQAMNTQQFIHSKQEIPRFGYTHDEIWAKLDIESSLDSSEEIFFEFRGPIERVTGYLVRNGSVVETERGGMFLLPEDESFISNLSYPVLKFKIVPGGTTLYFVETAVAPHFPIVAYNRAGYENRVLTHSSVLCLLFGICISAFLGLIVILFFVSGSSKLFLVTGFASFFILIGFVTGMFRTIYSGSLGFKWAILSNYLHFYPRWTIFLSIYLLSISMFSISHLGWEVFLRSRMSKFFTYIALGSQLLLGIVSVFDIVVAMKFFSAGFNITVAQAVYWSIQKYREGRKEELFAGVGWVAFGLLSSIQLSYFLGFSENSFFAVWGTVVGFFSILFLLTISLVERNRRDLYRTIDDKNQALVQLESNYKELRKKDETIQTQVLEKEKLRGMVKLGDLAEQVAHDIQSPLVALNRAMADSSPMVNEDRHEIVKMAIARIQSIASDLLNQSRKNQLKVKEGRVGIYGQNQEVNGALELVSGLVRSIVAEKRIEYLPRSQVNLKLEIRSEADRLVCKIPSTGFKRVLSNLINNAYEAIGEKGNISILLCKECDQAVLVIADTGKGIPQEILNQLGQKGVSYQKENGNGLGLYHARTSLEKWGGSLDIISELGKGTQIKLIFPC